MRRFLLALALLLALPLSAQQQRFYDNTKPCPGPAGGTCAVGDEPYASNATGVGAWGRLAIGSSGQIKYVNSGHGAWGDWWTVIGIPSCADTGGNHLNWTGSAWVCGTSSGSSGANTALSNLASMAINTSLLPGADNTINLGSASFRWGGAFLGNTTIVGSPSGGNDDEIRSTASAGYFASDRTGSGPYFRQWYIKIGGDAVFQGLRGATVTSTGAATMASGATSGTGGAGFYDFGPQSAPPSTPASNHFRLYADANGNPIFVNSATDSFTLPISTIAGCGGILYNFAAGMTCLGTSGASGKAVLQNGADMTNLELDQAADGDTALVGSRASDSSPTGHLMLWKSAAGAPLFDLNANGRVGIGNSNPQEPIDITSPGTGRGMRITGSASEDQSYRSQDSSGNGYAWGRDALDHWFLNRNVGGSFSAHVLDITTGGAVAVLNLSASAAVCTDSSKYFTSTCAATTAAAGGTGLTSLTAHCIIVGNGTSPATLVCPSSSGQFLRDNGPSSDPSFAAISVGTNVSTTSTSTNASFFPLFVASSSNGSQTVNLGTGITFNPSTNNLSTTTFTGALAGNATTASTATALAANGTNCTAGQFAAGVDATGNAEGCATPGGAGTGTPATLPSDVNSRLSLVSGDPAPTADTTAALVLYFEPFAGGTMSDIYNGTLFSYDSTASHSIKATDSAQTGTMTSGTKVITGLTDTSQLPIGAAISGTNVGAASVIVSVDSATQVTGSVNSTGSASNAVTFKWPASTNYDVCAEATSATVFRIRVNPWTSSGAGTSARAVAFTQASANSNTSGVIYNDAAIAAGNSNTLAAHTCRYLGTVRTTATAGQLEDSGTGSQTGSAKRFVWNMYHRIQRPIVRYAGSWTYNSTTIRQWNGSALNQLEIVVGQIFDAINIGASLRGSNGSGGQSHLWGTSENSTTTADFVYAPWGMWNSPFSGNPFSGVAPFVKIPVAIGYNYYSGNEQIGGSGTSTINEAALVGVWPY